MKYVIFEDKKSKLIHPILFPDSTTHSQIKVEGSEPISAGFWSYERHGRVKVFGKSESLKLEVRAEDALYIENVLMNLGTMHLNV
jgi:hypothetical protein